MSKITPERHDKIVHALRRGVPYATACSRAGISTATGWRWRREDARFNERCQMAESGCEQKLVSELLGGALDEETRERVFPDAVRSANLRWFLGARWPAKYGVGPIREKAIARELAESEGESDKGALGVELQAALIEFAKARTDEATWQAFLRWREMDKLVGGDG